jgi:hypothetical protein
LPAPLQKPIQQAAKRARAAVNIPLRHDMYYFAYLASLLTKHGKPLINQMRLLQNSLDEQNLFHV